MSEQRLVATYLEPDLLERCQSWGLLSLALGAGIFLGCLGAWLFIKPNTKETVRIEVPPVQVVKVEVPTPVVQPTAPAPTPDLSGYVRKDQLPQKTQTGEAIKREVTAFSNINHPPGAVVTGWNFKDGTEGALPFDQYCYYRTNTTENQESTTIYLAQNGVSLSSTDQSRVPNYAQALSECQWFDRSPTRVIQAEPPTINPVTTIPTSPTYTPVDALALISPETTARNSVRDFLEQWSNPKITTTLIATHYAASVFYFGKQTTQADIATDIEHNAERWRYRRYTISNNQITPTCQTPGVSGKYITLPSDYVVCDVDAMIEWHVANGQRKVGGLTQAFYEIGVRPADGSTAIYAQTENVINRHPD
jgi:hypothetical protein